VTPIQPGYSGLPDSLVRPDRNNFAPRIGFAWKPLSNTVVRGGYGINYNTGAYQGIAQQLALQPPFATTATNVQANPGLTLECSPPCKTDFPRRAPGTITNNYAVNPNYRLGYVQIRNLDIQQQIRPTLLLNLDYTGTKGTDLDILEAPNRTANGIRINGVDAFTYENSVADQEANAAIGAAAQAPGGDSRSAAPTRFPSRWTTHLPSARAQPRGRILLGWAGAAPALPEVALRRAEARPMLRRIPSICLRSAAFPASTRPTSSPRIICMSCPLVTTSAGSPEILRGAPIRLATGNGAAIGRSHRACRLRRDC
jgi:hypothetical protein